MARPSNSILQWAVQDITLPNLGSLNKKVPINDLQQKGWDMGQKPAADEFNYILNNFSDWITYLDEKTGGTAPTDFAIDSVPNTQAKRDGTGSSCFKQVKGEDITNTTRLDLYTKYQTKPALGIYSNTQLLGQFVASGLDATGSMRYGLQANTAGNHYGINNGINIGDCYGNADTSTQWKNKLTLSFNGAVSGQAQFDGNEGSINVTLNDSSNKIGAFNNLIWSGSATTKSFTTQELYNAAGYAQDTGYLGRFSLCFFLGDTGDGDTGNWVAVTTLPLSFIMAVKSSFRLFIDYGDSSDWILDVTYSAGIFNFTASGRGDIIAAYITA